MNDLTPHQEETLNKIWDGTNPMLLLSKPITAERLQHLWQWSSIPTYKRDISQEQQDLLKVGLLVVPKIRHLSYVEQTARCLAMDDVYLLGCISWLNWNGTFKENTEANRHYLLGSMYRHIPYLKAEHKGIDSIDLANAINKSREILASYDHQQSY